MGEPYTVDKIRHHLRYGQFENKPENPAKKLEPKPLLELLQKERTLDELADKSGMSARMVLAQIDDYRDAGYQIEEVNGKYFLSKITDQSKNVYNNDWQGEREITFGLVSDTHLCSKTQQLTHLNNFYDKCADIGISDIYHAGDWFDGMDVYPGQNFHIHKFGNDEQKEYGVKRYPSRPGIKTIGIGGNHDLKTYEKTGYDIVKALANERQDIEYLGQYFARVNLTPNCVLQLCHPMGKQAYSASYRIQRKIDSLSGGDKPAIIAEGHFHSNCYIFRRNVQGIMLPSFQGPNDLSRRLGLESDIGGAIITIKVDKEGTIREFTPKFIHYMVPLENDY